MKYFVRIGDNEYEVELDNDEVRVDGELVPVDLKQIGEPELYSMLYAGASYELLIEADRFNYAVTVRGAQLQVQVEDERTRKLNAGRRMSALPDGDFAVKAPIPGLVVNVLVSEGQAVEEDEPLLILEAMKMENEIRSLRAGVVKKIDVIAGQRVEQNAIMLVVE